MKNNNLIAYAMDFASFLVQKIKDKSIIQDIILFGSVSRDDFDKNSDVDIFINLVFNNKTIKSEINNILNEYLSSVKVKNYWAMYNVKNNINLTIGDINKWEELKPSIIANGITIYGKYKTDINGNHKTIFVFENIKPNSKRVIFNRQLFGYKSKGKNYLGILQKYNGKKLGKGCISVPSEHAVVFSNLFKIHKISPKIKKIIEYF